MTDVLPPFGHFSRSLMLQNPYDPLPPTHVASAAAAPRGVSLLGSVAASWGSLNCEATLTHLAKGRCYHEQAGENGRSSVTRDPSVLVCLVSEDRAGLLTLMRADPDHSLA